MEYLNLLVATIFSTITRVPWLIFVSFFNRLTLQTRYILLGLIDVVVAPPKCSFPFTYNGGLYYRCITNMADVTTADQPYACIDVNATRVVCDSPGWSLLTNRLLLILCSNQ